MPENYHSISLKKNAYDKAERLRQLKGKRSVAEIVSDLIDAAHEEVTT